MFEGRFKDTFHQFKYLKPLLVRNLP